MKEKKYIDRLYQEKFKDFEATPHEEEEVWKSISAKLQEKQREKPVVLPLWSRIAGVAAILTLILLIGEWMLPVQTKQVVTGKELEENPEPAFNFRSSGVAFATNEATETKEVESTGSKKGKKETPFRQERKISEVSSIESNKGGLKVNSLEIASAEIKQASSASKKGQGKSLFKEVEKQKEQLIAETSKTNFEVSTHAAPIYYGNFGKGNFLDPQFNNNSSQGEITYSYGVNIAYVISDKVKIRSGVSKVNMSYNTSGIAYHAVLGPVPISGVRMNTPSEPTGSTTGRKPSSSVNRATIGSLEPGLLNQKMGFIEVPVELEYNLIDKKFELNIIGGASTLFLDENSISLNSGSSTAMGQASNLNEVSFSTNIGLGLDYNLTEKFKLNLEPMLKYQLNTFNSASADNQPYYLGIYSGFSYKF